MKEIDSLSINAIRILSADAIQKAKSGHPGMPLGIAPAAYELWARHMNYDPDDTKWPDRDRFVLSSGHASMLLYSLLHLFGFGLTVEDIKDFRQYGSKTPGHPEYGRTPGVEATTGPLGSGLGMAVGMAIAEKHLAAVFNKEGYPIVDHYTYALCGDGCMMEGISSEALSLAGTLGLSKLIVIYDSNGISIEGSTDLAFRENTLLRMQAYGFQTITVEDGNDIDAIGKAIEAAKADRNHPSLIMVRTQIGYGCPAKQGRASAHGEPLGEENVKELRKALGWPYDEAFYVPGEVYENCRALASKAAQARKEWQRMFAAYCGEYPLMKELWDKYHDRPDADALLANGKLWLTQDKPEATRSISGRMINVLKDELPNLFGGSADLGPSNKTEMKGEPYFSAENPLGRNMHFGVREMAMAAIGNGMLLHGGVIPYVATFFVFSDYLKPMARLSSIMRLPLIYVFTHDSIGVGEDGPTHEPIEQLAMFRSLPNFHVFRPCDAGETSAAWLSAITSESTPTALVLTRQSVSPTAHSGREALKGGYVFDDCEGTPEAIIMASGSEVELAAEAKGILAGEGMRVRVVSMPSMEVFEEQDAAYRESVLPAKVRARVAVEALSGFGWDRYVGLDGAVVCMRGFGASGKGPELFSRFGITAENVAQAVRELR